MSNLTVFKSGKELELQARTTSNDESEIALCAALVIAKMRHEDVEDVEKMAGGDQDAYADFIDGNTLGDTVYEYVFDYFSEIAQNEIEARTEAAELAVTQREEAIYG